MSGDMTLSQAISAVDDPSTTGAELQAIAADHRMLWADIANHPNAYPDLLDWLARVGDEEVQAIVESRYDTEASPPPSPPKPKPVRRPRVTEAPVYDPPPPRYGLSRRTIIVAIVVAIALAVATAVAVWMVQGGKAPDVAPATVTITQTAPPTNTLPPDAQPTDSQPTDIQPTGSQPTGSQPTQAATTQVPGNQNPHFATDPPVAAVIKAPSLPSLPSLSTAKVKVQTNGFSATPVQKLADDIAAGNVTKIVNSCWTQPSSDNQKIFGSASMRGAILQALTTKPSRVTAQGLLQGVVWQGDHVRVSALDEELRSGYACVMVDWGGEGVGKVGTFTPAMAQWRLKRIVGQYDAKPVNSKDFYTEYELFCGPTDCGGDWSAHKTQKSNNPKGQSPIVSAGDAQVKMLR